MLCVRKDHIFADFGHGIGNACLQASYTIGCQSKGIELVNARFYVSEALNRSIVKATEEMVAIDVRLRMYLHYDFLIKARAIFIFN